MSNCSVQQVASGVCKGVGAVFLGVSGVYLYIAIRLLEGHDGPGSFSDLEDWEKKEAGATCLTVAAGMLLTSGAMFRFSSFPNNSNLLPIITDKKLFLILLGMISSFTVISNVFFAIQCMTGDCHDVSDTKRGSIIGSYFFSAGLAVATQVGATLFFSSCGPEQRTVEHTATGNSDLEGDIALNAMHAATTL